MNARILRPTLTLLALLALPTGVLANLTRHNEQGLSPTHSYKSSAPDEAVSNLNGNLTITSVAADITRVPLGIKVERAWNSHWREALFTQQLDLWYDNFKPGGNDDEGPEYRNWDAPAKERYKREPLGGGLARNYRYEIQSIEDLPTMWPFFRNLGFNMAQGEFVDKVTPAIPTPETPTDPGTGLPAPKPGSISDGVPWAFVGAMAANIGWDLIVHGKNPAEQWREFVRDLDTFQGMVGLAQTTTRLGAEIAQRMSQTAAKETLGNIAGGLAILMSVYNLAETLNNQPNKWDPAGDVVVAAAFVNVGFAVAAVFINPVFAIGALALQVGVMLMQYLDMENNRFDVAEAVPMPWTLGVNGFIGMVGTKYAENQTRSTWHGDPFRLEKESGSGEITVYRRKSDNGAVTWGTGVPPTGGKIWQVSVPEKLVLTDGTDPVVYVLDPNLQQGLKSTNGGRAGITLDSRHLNYVRTGAGPSTSIDVGFRYEVLPNVYRNGVVPSRFVATYGVVRPDSRGAATMAALGQGTFSKNTTLSWGPMEEMYLLRSTGGSSRFILQRNDVRQIDGRRYYAYTSLSKGEKTQVFYVDLPNSTGLYENGKMSPADGNGSGPGYAVDPSAEDYYLVLEPSGLRAYFGETERNTTKTASGTPVAAKGIYRQAIWDWHWEGFWALPTSFGFVRPGASSVAEEGVLVCRDAKNQIESVRFASNRSAAVSLCDETGPAQDRRHVEVMRSYDAKRTDEVTEEKVVTLDGQTAFETTTYAMGTHKFKHHRLKEIVPDPNANSFFEKEALEAFSNAANPALSPFVHAAVQKILYPATIKRRVDTIPVVTSITRRVNGKDHVTRFEYDGGNLVRSYQPNGSLISYDFDASEKESRLDGFCNRKVHWEDATDTSANSTHRLWAYQYFGWFDVKQTGFKAASGSMVLQTEITDELSSKDPSGRTPGVLKQQRKDIYRFRAAYDGVNVRRSNKVIMNITDLTDDEDRTNPEVKKEESTEYRTARFQLITQILGADGEGLRTDFDYDGDLLVRKQESYSRTGRASPTITTYQYDDWGNQTVERVNATSELQDVEVKSRVAEEAVKSLDFKSGRMQESDLKTAFEGVDPQAAIDEAVKIQGLDRVTTTVYKNSPTGRFYLLKPDGDAKPWGEDPEVKVQEYLKTLNPDFDPRKAYIAGAPVLKLVTRRTDPAWEARTGLAGSGWYGVQTIYDDAFRPVAESAWVNTVRVPVRHNFYTDDNNPWFRTGEAIFRSPEQVVDGISGKGTFTFVAYESDPDYHQYVAKQTQYVDTFSIASLPANGALPTLTGRTLATTTTYNAKGLPLVVTDARDVETTTEYDELDRPTKVTKERSAKPGRPADPIVVVKSTEYLDQVQGEVGIGWMETGANGVSTRVEFDRLGRLNAVHRFSKNVSADQECVKGSTNCTSQRTDYGVHGKLRWAQDAVGRQVINEFDPYGRQTKTKILSKTGDVAFQRSYRYDDWKRILYETDERGLVTEFHYDAYGQDTLVRREIESNPDNSRRFYEARSTFDNLGNLLEVRDPNGLLTRTLYNFQSKPVVVLHPDLLADTTSFDLLGQPYKAVRRKMAYELADGTDGKVLKTIESKLGDRTQVDFAYDGLNRQVLADVKDRPELKRVFHYDTWGTANDPGMLVGIERGSTLKATFAYNMFGSMTARNLVVLPAANEAPIVEQAFGWEFNDDQTRKSMSLPGGATAEYVYDNFGRLSGMDLLTPAPTGGTPSTIPAVASIKYNPDDNIHAIELGNGVHIGTRFNDVRPLLDTLVAVKGDVDQDGDTLYLQQYLYDAVGNVTGLRRFNGEVMDLQYDKLNQLSALRYPGGVSGGRANQVYRYDLNGNRTSMSHDFGGYSVDYRPGTENPGALPATSAGAHLNLMREMLDTASATRVSYGFDSRGNRNADTVWNVLDPAHTTGKWASRRAFRFNDADEMERVFRWTSPTAPADGWAYTYDENGNRVLKRTLGPVTGTDTTWNALSETAYDGVWVASEKAPDGLWRWHLRVGHRRVLEARQTSSGTVEPLYVVTDHLGTTNLLLDGTGREVQRYVLDPWGNLEQAVVTAEGEPAADGTPVVVVPEFRSTTNFLYTGKEYDPETGLIYVNARYLDPTLGMWTGRDLKRELYSSYGFVGGNPLKLIDPDGQRTYYVAGTGGADDFDFRMQIGDYSGEGNAATWIPSYPQGLSGAARTLGYQVHSPVFRADVIKQTVEGIKRDLQMQPLTDGEPIVIAAHSAGVPLSVDVISNLIDAGELDPSNIVLHLYAGASINGNLPGGVRAVAFRAIWDPVSWYGGAMDFLKGQRVETHWTWSSSHLGVKADFGDLTRIESYSGGMSTEGPEVLSK